MTTSKPIHTLRTLQIGDRQIYWGVDRMARRVGEQMLRSSGWRNPWGFELHIGRYYLGTVR